MIESPYRDVRAHSGSTPEPQPDGVVGKEDYAFCTRDPAAMYRADDEAVWTTEQVLELDERSVVFGEEDRICVSGPSFYSDNGPVGCFPPKNCRVTVLKKAGTDLQETQQQFRFLITGWRKVKPEMERAIDLYVRIQDEVWTEAN
jgi:hypothetical protein